MAQNRNRERRAGALRTRLEAAQIAANRLHAGHRNNGDETTVEDAAGALNFAGNYAKGLQHAPNGDVDRGAYGTLLQALASGNAEDFERIRLGTPPGIMRRKLTNPQAGLAFSLAGPDAQEPTLPPAPAYGSDETAAEAAELYWMAVLHDVPFADYAANPTAGQAAMSLSNPSAGGEFSVETSPRNGINTVAPVHLFRGALPGDLEGPYVSQFMLQGTDGPCPPNPANSPHPTQVRQDGMLGYGAQRIDQRILTAAPGQDFLTNPGSWLDSQNGKQADQGIAPDCTPKFIRNLRDLGVHVRADRNYQHYFNAALLLQNPNHLAPSVPDRSPIRLPVTPPGNPDGTDFGNPYNTSEVQEGFATFGDWHLLALLAEVTTRALKAAWYQKWYVHRRLRPEEYGDRVQRRITGGVTTNPDIHPELVAAFNGARLPTFYGPAATTAPTFNNYLLPQAFPEGSPLHPAYPSGHATVAGACVTLLKAWFDDERPLTDFLPNAYVPSADGERLDPAPGALPSRLRTCWPTN